MIMSFPWSLQLLVATVLTAPALDLSRVCVMVGFGWEDVCVSSMVIEDQCQVGSEGARRARVTPGRTVSGWTADAVVAHRLAIWIGEDCGSIAGRRLLAASTVSDRAYRSRCREAPGCIIKAYQWLSGCG